MKLVTPEKVVQSLGLAVNPGSVANANLALEASYPILESLLESSFQQGKTTDYYSVDLRHPARVRTTRSFVDALSVVVRVSTNGLPLAYETDGCILEPQNYRVLPDTGVVDFFTLLPLGLFSLSITYEHGLSETDDDETILLAPYWLEQAAIYMTSMVLSTQQVSPPTRKDKRAGAVCAEQYRAAMAMMAPYLRPRMSIDYPTRAVHYDL